MERVGPCTSVQGTVYGFRIHNFAMTICCTLGMKML